MSNDISSDQIEIILEFVQESRDMIDQLEPIIIELGQSCQKGDCWDILGCQNADCHRQGHSLSLPCWLDTGYIGNGKQTCPHGSSEQDCKKCAIFQKTNGNIETINAIFRLFHSMKGSAGFLDLVHLAAVAHAAESLLDLVRSGKIQMDASHVDLLCQSCDFAKEALELVESEYNDQATAAIAMDVTARLKRAAEEALERVNQVEPVTAATVTESEPETYSPPRQEPEPEDAGAPKDAAMQCFELEITPEMVERFTQEADELLQSAEQGLLQWTEAKPGPDVIASLFRNIHSFKGNCGFFGYSDLERLSHQMESVLDLVKSGKELANPNPADTLLICLDVLRVAVADVSDGGNGKIATLTTYQQQLDALMGVQAKAGAVMPRAAVPPAPVAPPIVPSQPKPAAKDQPAPEPVKTQPPAAPTKPAAPKPASVAPPAPPAAAGSAKAATKRQDLRVDLDKLDQLINLIGEMVIAENMLIHNPDIVGLELENFHKAGQQMSKLVRELQEIAMTIRMIPVSGLFRRMIRLVHDLSLKAGKKVELVLSGEDTEVDKTVIETITDPLVHLIRNSLDHGLEPPAERLQAGKPEKGVVRLSARHEEGQVWIAIEDDGRGLNRDKILAKAISRGMIEGDGSDLSDKAIYSLIFQAGFSTADTITDVSGRGVGMDVVKQNIEKIKGKIEVTSKPGKGTRMILRIPLTLGIIDGMMVRVGDTKCIVPTLTIREAFRPVDEAITITPDGQELARVRENFYPVIRLHEVLAKEPQSHELSEGILILLDYQDKGICLFVDEILGQQQTVIKGLSDYIGNVRWVSGCTILGDGEVCLILDVGHLVEMFDMKEALGA